MSAPSQVVILGSGIIGLCSAYEVLKLSPTSKVVLVEASPGNLIAGGASSYAGGFIACGPDCEYHPSLSGSSRLDLGSEASTTPHLTRFGRQLTNALHPLYRARPAFTSSRPPLLGTPHRPRRRTERSGRVRVARMRRRRTRRRWTWRVAQQVPYAARRGEDGGRESCGGRLARRGPGTTQHRRRCRTDVRALPPTDRPRRTILLPRTQSH